MGLSEVSAILWRERQLLDTLAFKLKEEHLLLLAGEQQWLSKATLEVTEVLEAIKAAELSRALETQDLIMEFGLDPMPTLDELAQATPAAWHQTFSDHKSGLMAALAKIADLAELNRSILTRHLSAIAETLSMLGEVTGGSYDRAGAPSTNVAPSRLVDSSA
ncbi:MAG: flagellar export chaperone FlgN [Actinomycetota bacterium]|jgi:hypothetical protein|nr:flagellar export chaperone FlgN [Actinomycetota bacterium]